MLLQHGSSLPSDPSVTHHRGMPIPLIWLCLPGEMATLLPVSDDELEAPIGISPRAFTIRISHDAGSDTAWTSNS